MIAVDRERWHRASPHLDRALELGREERAAWLAELREADATLAADVEALLAEHVVLLAARFLEDDGHVRPAATLAGITVGAYTLIERIAQGGMGSVWLASRSDGRFDGRAALKLLNVDLIGRAGLERFRREATMLARFAHPHIARLFDAGTSTAGQPYLVLELVEGTHLDRYCDERALDVEARLALFLIVLSAVAHIHDRLVVHLDLKPSNILVTASGDVKLIDFGVARFLNGNGQSPEPQPPDPLGGGLTPIFAAPEQLSDGPTTIATDIYTLGVLLFGLLTGRYPVRSSGRSADRPPEMSSALMEDGAATEPIDRIAARRATTPDRLRRRLKGDLDAIVAKAMSNRPDARYISVDAFAADLRRSLEHRPRRHHRRRLGQ